MVREDYPYFYETHLHTSESSRCANNSGEEMAMACKEAGYTGIIVTDHNWYGNNCIDGDLPWQEWVEEYCKGYENAKKWGDKNGLQVFFGYESAYKGTEFLIYGVDKLWLKEHYEIKDASVEEQYRLIHEAGGMVIHAHPFRAADYIPQTRLFPDYVDGVEGINATHSSHLSTNHNNPEWDRQAIRYGLEHNLPLTAGSDVHSTFLFGGGMAFKRKLTSIQDFCKAILSGEDYIITNGDEWFSKKGEDIRKGDRV
ncbi:MAG: PHP domain-containing protein [Lachnospiraceae bacterium]|nr:PHP domain-containing protein [Lachnospiraceae bacterium]